MAAFAQRFGEKVSVENLAGEVGNIGLRAAALAGPDGYTLLVTTKEVELDLANHFEALTKFYRDLDRIHDFIHEIYPAK